MKNILDNSQPDSISTARLTSCIALAYALLGAFGLMLAIGSGYASPIFPAAGLALVAVLWFGRRALPGIWLGSVVMNMMVALLHNTLSPNTAALALLIASGATAQAWMGCWLVNRWQKSAWRHLERESDAFIFLLLGGVLSCLLSSAVGVTGLYAVGVVKPGDFMFSYWNWYVGDTLGVLIFAPLLLRIFNRAAGSSIDRKRYTFMPMLLILGLLWLAFYGSTHVIIKEQEYQLKTDCAVIAKRIADRLLTHREVLTSLHNFIEATPKFSFKQFELFTKISLQDNPDIFALSFNDLVALDQRTAYERRISSLSPLGRFRIVERDSQRRLIVAAERPEYVAVRYIVPLAGNAPAVGFDINSEPIRHDAINRAKATKSMAVTAPIQLVQEQKKRIGVLELMPVLDHPESDGREQTNQRLLGFAVSVVKIDEMVEIATRGHVPTGLLFQVTDPQALEGNELLYRSEGWSADISRPELPGWKTGLRVGDREWTFAARATDAYLQRHRPLLAWVMGGVAIFITGLIQLLIIGMNGRLSEITRTNNAVNSSLDNLFNYANVPIIVWDAHNRITRFSRAFELLSGRRAEEVIAQDISVIFRDINIDSSLKPFSAKLNSEHWESVELPVLHVNGTVSTVLWNVSVIMSADASPVATIAQGHDITARKRLEDELQQRTCALGDANTLLEQEMAERQMAQEALTVKQMQLESLNNTLQLRIDEALTELRQKDQMMISQSRQVAMGEMIGNIAHHWRQPLNALAMVLGNIQAAYQYDELTDDYVEKTITSGNNLLQKLSTTINDFRNFFLPDKEAVSFSAQNQINKALSLVEAGLKNKNITIRLEADQDVVLTGLPNEFSQVILNLLTNAGEAIKAKCVLEGLITIRLFERDGWGCVSIRDNGGGIAADVIDKIFEPYFSTKKMGTGIGLYMSKMIIERSMNGTIEAHNSDDGAEFIVSIPQGAAL